MHTSDKAHNEQSTNKKQHSSSSCTGEQFVIQKTIVCHSQEARVLATKAWMLINHHYIPECGYIAE